MSYTFFNLHFSQNPNPSILHLSLLMQVLGSFISGKNTRPAKKRPHYMPALCLFWLHLSKYDNLTAAGKAPAFPHCDKSEQRIDKSLSNHHIMSKSPAPSSVPACSGGDMACSSHHSHWEHCWGHCEGERRGFMLNMCQAEGWKGAVQVC